MNDQPLICPVCGEEMHGTSMFDEEGVDGLQCDDIDCGFCVMGEDSDWRDDWPPDEDWRGNKVEELRALRPKQ